MKQLKLLSSSCRADVPRMRSILTGIRMSESVMIYNNERTGHKKLFQFFSKMTVLNGSTFTERAPWYEFKSLSNTFRFKPNFNISTAYYRMDSWIVLNFKEFQMKEHSRYTSEDIFYFVEHKMGCIDLKIFSSSMFFS